MNVQYLTSTHVIHLHQWAIEGFSGERVIIDRGLIESAVAQPQMTFDGQDLHPTVIDKAAALGFSLCQNHPFLDGNKRTALASVAVFLELNDWSISYTQTEIAAVFDSVACGDMDR